MLLHAIILLFLYGSVHCNKTTIFNEIITHQSEFYKNLQLQDVSSPCSTSIAAIQEVFALNNWDKVMEVLKFADASSKIPNGVLAANLYDFGNYEECMNIHFNLEKEEIWGRYCAGASYLTIPNTGVVLPLQMAYCVPHTCTKEDVTALIPIGYFIPDNCYSKLETHDFDASDITAIVFFSFFLFLVVVCTGIDAFYQYFEREIPNKLLIAFSIWTNGKKIFQTSTSSEQLSCLNGIKAISMGWVILGHGAGAAIMDNAQDMLSAMKNLKNMYLMGAPVSVDTFLLVGGLLVMYVFMKANDKGVKLNVPMFYLHRYLRLTPALAVLVLFNATLVRYFGSGPLWGGVEAPIEFCRKYWWSTLLYIQNYVNPNENCSGQTWYLSVDMQLFILTPIILFPMQKWPKVGIYSLIVLTGAGILVPFLVTYQRDLPASMNMAPIEQVNPYMWYYYIQTHTRFGPYVIGMIVGYLIFMAQKNPDFVLNKIKENKIVIIVLWLIAIGGLLACTYGGYDIITLKIADKASRSLYNGFNRSGWAVAVSLVIILCCLDCGGPINVFLSAPIFQFLSKLSYSMYLVHVTWIIDIKMLSTKNVTHFSEMNMWFNFWGDFMITLFASFVLCVVFESPMIIIEKAIFGNLGKKPTEKPPNPA